LLNTTSLYSLNSFNGNSGKKNSIWFVWQFPGWRSFWVVVVWVAVFPGGSRPVTRGAKPSLEKFSPPLEKCVGHNFRPLDTVQKFWAPLRKLFAPPGVISWLRTWVARRYPGLQLSCVAIFLGGSCPCGSCPGGSCPRTLWIFKMTTIPFVNFSCWNYICYDYKCQVYRWTKEANLLQNPLCLSACTDLHYMQFRPTIWAVIYSRKETTLHYH